VDLRITQANVISSETFFRIETTTRNDDLSRTVDERGHFSALLSITKGRRPLCAYPTCRRWISDFPCKPQRRGLLVGDSPSQSACYVSTEGLPRFYPPTSRSMDFFLLPICGRRPDSSSVRVTSSQHPRISSANLFMDDARGGTAHCVPKTQRYV